MVCKLSGCRNADSGLAVTKVQRAIELAKRLVQRRSADFFLLPFSALAISRVRRSRRLGFRCEQHGRAVAGFRPRAPEALDSQRLGSIIERGGKYVVIVQSDKRLVCGVWGGD